MAKTSLFGSCQKIDWALKDPSPSVITSERYLAKVTWLIPQQFIQHLK